MQFAETSCIGVVVWLSKQDIIEVNKEQNHFTGFDLIGDVHGCGRALVDLLHLLGYQQVKGAFQYSNQAKPRQVIFVGDIIDRGPRIREALHTVYDMVERGSARLLMGNHEYNALGYCTEVRSGSGGTRKYLREHGPRHDRLIRETLEQFANYPQEWRAFLDWFISLPVFLEMPDFRVVHACWDDALIQRYIREYGGNVIDWDFLHQSVDKQSFAGQFMDRLTRGIDLALPDGQIIQGGDGFSRKRFRVKFWEKSPQRYEDIAFQPDPLPDEIARRRLKEIDKMALPHYSEDQKPLFTGHYWLSGKPEPLTANLACLDYSAVKNGRLVAYRMDGEKRLSKEKFVWVNVTRDSSIA